MPTAFIHYPGAAIRLESERLLVTYQDDEGVSQRRLLPLHDLERIIFTDAVACTTPALAESMRRGIPIGITDRRGRFIGGFYPASNDHGASRLRQYQRTLEPRFCHDMAARLIAAKIYNQRRLLQRVGANRQAAGNAIPSGHEASLQALARATIGLDRAESLDAVRGYEGVAAARYFAAWAALLPTGFAFERRSTRPPLNPVNAVLSFSATLIYHEMHALIHAHGLDPALGFLHATENGRWSLALDLMEPFRPVLAEALTLDLFSHKILNASHFEPSHGGVYLTHEGRNKLLLQYEKRMDRQFMSEAIAHRTTLRKQLENQALMFKSALDDPAKFTPFQMN